MTNNIRKTRIKSNTECTKAELSIYFLRLDDIDQVHNSPK
jgi:hypothetical protein